jgi:hypothetical protein
MLGHDFEIGSKNEKKIDTKKPMTIKHSAQYYLDIMENLHRGLYLGTGHRLAQGESEYERRHIDLTEPYRIGILKGLSPQQKTTLFKDLTLLSDAIDSFIDIIENNESDDYETRRKKEELVKNE